MKQLFFLTLVAAAISSCSSDDDGVYPNDPRLNATSEIKFNTNVYGVNTKAPVTPTTSIDAVFVASTATGNYGTYSWSDTVTFTASPTPTTGLSFTPSRYYPVDNSAVYIKGYYPQSPAAITNNTVTYSATDGSVDLLLTPEVSGTRTSAPLNFVFSHLLSQLQFQFVAGTGFPTGKTVTALRIKNAQTFPTQLDLNTGNVTYSTSNINFTGKSYSIASSASPIADFPMVAPGQSVVLSITTSDGVTYPDFTVPTLTTVVGQSHLITITFNITEIKINVSVTNWVVGPGGSSSVA